MITNEKLTELFKPLFDAAISKGLKPNSVMFHPNYINKVTFGHESDLIDAENFDELLGKIKELPEPKTASELTAERIAALKAELAKLEAGQ